LIYAKIAAVVALLAAIAWGAVADYSAGKKAGQSSVQAAWDEDRIKIQAAADVQIAQITKERDSALEANGVLRDGYEARLLTADARNAQFTSQLRNAAAIIATYRNSVPKTDSGQSSVAVVGPTSADQLGELVKLTADLHAECTANADRHDVAYKELTPQITVQ
jgi:hypothetical protein